MNSTNSNSTAESSNGGAIEERYLRNASIIDQEAINRQPVAIVGVGAIGSHLAEMLAKLGVRNFTLIDPDEVDEINLSTQGFAENQVGQLKVEAVEDRTQPRNRRPTPRNQPTSPTHHTQNPRTRPKNQETE